MEWKEMEFYLGEHAEASRVNISMHVDSIQAVLSDAAQNPHIYRRIGMEGRETRTVDQVDSITGDPLYLLFTSLRSTERSRTIRQFGGEDVRNLDLRAGDSSSDKPFETVFFDLNKLAGEYKESRLLPNHLMPVLGGITIISLGGNVPASSLKRAGRRLTTLIRDRQYAGTSLTARGVDLNSNYTIKSQMSSNLL